MKTSLSKLTPLRILARWVRHFGYALVPVAEIEHVEEDGRELYSEMAGRPAGSTDRAYWNGMADYASKLAHKLRSKYLQ